MIAIRGLAVVAIFGCVAIALAPTSGADPARKDALSFARQAERACLATNAQKLVLRRPDRACAVDMYDKLVSRVDRPQLAAIHHL